MTFLRIMVIVFLCQVLFITGTAQEVPPTSGCVKRLDKHVNFLNALNKQFQKPLITVDDTMQTLCKHELTQWCIKKIHDEQTIDALFDVWQAFKHHSTDECLEDEVFIRDFSALIYISYMHVITVATRSNVQDFMVLYHQILMLPLPDLLDLLDIFFKKLGVVLQAYSVSTVSYADQAKLYWWAPAAILAAVGTSILHWYLRRPVYESLR